MKLIEFATIAPPFEAKVESIESSPHRLLLLCVPSRSYPRLNKGVVWIGCRRQVPLAVMASLHGARVPLETIFSC